MPRRDKAFKVYTDGESTRLIRGKGWEVIVVKGKDVFSFVDAGMLYERRYDALFALEIRPATLTVIDAYWRQVDFNSFRSAVRSIVVQLATRKSASSASPAQKPKRQDQTSRLRNHRRIRSRFHPSSLQD